MFIKTLDIAFETIRGGTPNNNAKNLHRSDNSNSGNGTISNTANFWTAHVVPNGAVRRDYYSGKCRRLLE
jgi:hypothetical protein